MVSQKHKSTLFIVLTLMFIMLLSSFASANTTLLDSDKKIEDIKTKYDYVTVDELGDVYYKNDKVKYIDDGTLNKVKFESSKGKLEFLDVDALDVGSSDYIIKDKIIGFDSEKYKENSKDKLTSFMKPVQIDNNNLAVAELTFNLSNEDYIEDNSTHFAFIYKIDEFTDNYDYIIQNGQVVDMIEFTGDSIEYYADSFSTFAVVTLTTNAPAEIRHDQIDFVPQYYAQIDNPDSLSYNILTQVKQVLDANYQTLDSITTTASQAAGTYTLGYVDLPETHVRYRYRVAFLEGGVLYTSASQPTFDIGVFVSNGDESSITDTSVTLEGQIGDSLNGYSSLSCGFNYRESGTSTWSNSGETTVSSLYDDYTRTITGLIPNTEYEWRATCWDARNGLYIPAGGNLNDWYSFTETFTTDETVSTTPEVTTNTATSVGDTTASLNGDLTTLGDETSVTGRFLYRKVGTSTYTSVGDQTLTSTGTFTHSLTGLDSCTNYEYKARVAYGLDVDDGAIQTFQTTGCPTGTGIATDLISYYKLDETTGTSASDSHGSNTGTVTWATWTTGKINNGLNFDGTNDYLNTNINPSSLIGAGDFTVSTWFNTDTITGYRWVFDMGDNKATFEDHIGVRLFNTDDIYLTYRDGSTGGGDVLISQVSTSTWYNLALTRTGTTIKVYVNGVSKLNLTDSEIGVSGFDSMLIGKGTNTAGSEYWDGMLDEVGIWSRALTSEEVSDLYNSGVGLAYEDFESYTFNPPSISLGTPTVYANSLLITSELIDLGNATSVDVGYLITGGDLNNISICEQTLTTIDDFSCNVALDYNTSYDIQAFATYEDTELNELTIYTETQTFTTDTASDPTIETAEVDSNTGTTVSLVGTVNSMGSYSELRCYHQIKESTASEWVNSPSYQTVLNTYSFPYDFTNDFTGLSLSSDYDYRAICLYGTSFLTNVTGTTYSFTTLSTSINDPEISLEDALNIDLTTATLRVIVSEVEDTEPAYSLNFRYRETNTTSWTEVGTTIITENLTDPYTFDVDVANLTSNTQYEYQFIFKYYVVNDTIQTTMVSNSKFFQTDSEGQIVDEDSINDFFDNFTAGNKTVKFIVALVLIIGMFIFGFQVTNTVIGGGIMAVLGLILSVVLGLIGIWVLILLLVGICLPFIFKLAFGRN